MSDLLTHTDAEFSPGGLYRYKLVRAWSAGPAILWLMLNPSTADADINDPTVERCYRRALAGGYGCMWVGNLFALRSADPGQLYHGGDPVGPRNDAAIEEMARASQRIVCAWGEHGAYLGRDRVVLQHLHCLGIAPHCLRLTAGGNPGHPLYVPYDVEPAPWPGYENKLIPEAASETARPSQRNLGTPT